MIAAQLANATVCSVDEAPDLDEFDTVILGSAIYATKPMRSMMDFCQCNEELLLEKKLGLFICALADGSLVEKELQNAFSPSLINHASAVAWLGGKITLGKCSAKEKTILKLMGKAKDIDALDQVAIKDFVEKLVAA